MTLAEVRLQEGESIENALRRFKRKVQTEDIIKEIKRHSYYLKPGAKRRVKTSSGATACPKEGSQRGTKFESPRTLLVCLKVCNIEQTAAWALR
jgi:small subunit ribosomal protein S21